MSSFSEDLTKELAASVLKETADNFFGHRRNIELEIDFLKKNIQELKKQAQKIEDLKAILANFLVTKENWVKFWENLNIQMDYTPYATQEINCPFALFLRKKYKKCFCLYYLQLSKKIKEYREGKVKLVKNRKQVTFHYDLAVKLIDKINSDIENVNKYYSPSEFLQFCKQVSLDDSQKADITGSGFVYNIDQEFKFKKMTADDFGLKVYPYLPTDKKTVKKILSFLDSVYTNHKKHIKSIL
ncbi:MAG: hypothetical protein Q9M37_08105 [Desulfonauticus sp.]|nr:hypothetical protein [Desulfonauticus sp.]